MPYKTVLPSSKYIIWSVSSINYSACVAIILVFDLKKPIKTRSNILNPICESNALKESSINIISGSEYAILAIETLCFYPPERFIPHSPISVKSPPGNILKSGNN